MNITTIKLKLVRQAKSKGGDRYEATVVEGENPLAIYLPQIITRPNGVPLNEIEMVLNKTE